MKVKNKYGYSDKGELIAREVDLEPLQKYHEELMKDLLHDTKTCNCIGPQNGEPKCPCMMRGVRIIDGEYVQITKLGKVKL